MIRVDQTRLGKPYGNCLAACVASILEISIDEVDKHIPADDSWLSMLNKYLATLGLYYLTVKLPKESKDDFLKEFPACYHTIAGNSPRGIRHSVVGYKGKMIHDPHPSRAGLIDQDETEYSFFIRLDQPEKQVNCADEPEGETK